MRRHGLGWFLPLCFGTLVALIMAQNGHASTKALLPGQCVMCSSYTLDSCRITTANECCSDQAWLECSEFGCFQSELDFEQKLCGFVGGELSDVPEDDALDPDDCSRGIDEANQESCQDGAQ